MCRYSRQRELVAETMPLTESSHTRIHRSDSICMMLFKKSSKPKQFMGGGAAGEVVEEAAVPGLASKMACQCRRWNMGLGEPWESDISSCFRFSSFSTQKHMYDSSFRVGQIFDNKAF